MRCVVSDVWVLSQRCKKVEYLQDSNDASIIVKQGYQTWPTDLDISLTSSSKRSCASSAATIPPGLPNRVKNVEGMLVVNT